ncbi:MAG: class I SAM-dependent methyltransferase [Actinomycetota bacterium]|nr:class I SAM-dependent methyltransferase [Actinomycetota bacterium]
MSSTERSGGSQSAYDLQSAFKARDGREAAELYDSWAEDYERSVASWGYTTPAVAAGLFGRYVGPEDGTVLDAGAGTGITGEILALIGHGDLVGIDVAPKMLEIARRKGVYKDLRQMELGGRLDFPDDAFAAVISTGTFAAGHAPPESFDDLIRVTRPGGHIVVSVRTDVYEDGGFKEKQEALEGEEKWRLLDTSAPFAHLRFEDPDLKIQVFAYRVL